MIELSGGAGAPGRARCWVSSRLDGELIGISHGEVALIVSELVTNSVVHAGVDASQLLKISVARLTGGWRITVIDPGSDTEPHLRPLDPLTPGGMGLRLIDGLCPAWGTSRGADGRTHVWCDLPGIAGERS